jgi:hypothetical protein
MGFGFLGTANPLGFLAPDIPKPGFQVPINPEPTVEFAFPVAGSRERESEPDIPNYHFINNLSYSKLFEISFIQIEK